MRIHKLLSVEFTIPSPFLDRKKLIGRNFCLDGLTPEGENYKRAPTPGENPHYNYTERCMVMYDVHGVGISTSPIEAITYKDDSTVCVKTQNSTYTFKYVGGKDDDAECQ